MKNKKFSLKYDPGTDVLNVSFGKARKAVSVEKAAEVYLRVDPKTKYIF